MKKYFITAMLATVMAGSIFASPYDLKDYMADHLSTHFKDATNIHWKTTSDFTEADFTWENQTLQAFYDQDGNYLGTGRDVTIASLPLNALKTLQDKYRDYQATSALQFQDSGDGVNYYVMLENDKGRLVLNVTPTGYVTVFKKLPKNTKS
jgi:hypothetical protein